MKRKLFALRISIQLPGRPDPWDAIVRIGKDPEIRLPSGGKFCDVVAGSIVDTGSTGLRKVVRVKIADAIPQDHVGRVVTSGRAWLRGE